MRRTLRCGGKPRGVALILMMVMLPLFLIPLVGIAIDGTMCYIVQAKLSAAVDGAALGAGRLLGTKADPKVMAQEFLNVNYPNSYWGSPITGPTNGAADITYTNVLGTHTITVTAQATVPMLFLRVIGQYSTVVAATATATKKDTRVMLVLDHSGSMDTTDPVSKLNVFNTMVSSAKQFVGMFTPGTDEVGLVVYNGSGVVAYPTTRPYNPSPTSMGGPDGGFLTQANPNPAGPVWDQLNLLQAGGYTDMTEGLSLAYIELQKAHYRDLASKGSDTIMNAVVLFTDGMPQALALHVNDASSLPASNALKPSGSGNGQSKCTWNPESTTDTTTQMRGYVTWGIDATSGPSTGNDTSLGLYMLGAYDNTHTLTWWIQSTGATDNKPSPTTPYANCKYFYNSNYYLDDMAKIPDKDLYGNLTTGVADTWSTWHKTAFNAAKPTVAYQEYLAGWNTTDNAGQTIRSQTIMNPITIYTIGYDGDVGGTDSNLLIRLANDPRAKNIGNAWHTDQQTGQFYIVHTADDLSSAFSMVASQVLRLAK